MTRWVSFVARVIIGAIPPPHILAIPFCTLRQTTNFRTHADIRLPVVKHAPKKKRMLSINYCPAGEAYEVVPVD